MDNNIGYTINKQDLNKNITYNVSKFEFTRLDTKLKQQIDNWGPPSLIKASICFLLIGIILFYRNQDIEEFTFRYDSNDQNNDCSSIAIGQECQIELKIPNDIPGPVYMYYELHQFNQNHQVYLSSYDDDQIQKGKNYDLNNNDSKNLCKPFVTNKEMGVTTSITGKSLDPNEIAIPCGIRAKLFFQDSFQIQEKVTERELQINQNNISWEYDQKRFKNVDLDKQWIDLEQDQHFQNWLRPAPLSKFRKLWGVIGQKIIKGTYTMKITKNFDSKYFECENWIVLTNLSATGADNPTLVYGHLVAGIGFILLFVFMMVFGIQQNSLKTQLSKTD